MISIFKNFKVIERVVFRDQYDLHVISEDGEGLILSLDKKNEELKKAIEGSIISFPATEKDGKLETRWSKDDLLTPQKLKIQYPFEQVARTWGFDTALVNKVPLYSFRSKIRIKPSIVFSANQFFSTINYSLTAQAALCNYLVQFVDNWFRPDLFRMDLYKFLFEEFHLPDYGSREATYYSYFNSASSRLSFMAMLVGMKKHDSHLKKMIGTWAETFIPKMTKTFERSQKVNPKISRFVEPLMGP